MTTVLLKGNAGDWRRHEAEIFNEDKKSNKAGKDIEVLNFTRLTGGKIVPAVSARQPGRNPSSCKLRFSKFPNFQKIIVVLTLFCCNQQ